MERAKFARADKMIATLSCPLCLEMVKDCVVTPCGHSFCRSCAGDAVTRKHTCPVCQVGIIGGEAGLIRNFLVDEVTQALSESTEETDVAYMRLLFEKAADHGKRGRSHGEIEEQTKYYSGDSKSSPSQPQQNLLRQVDTSEAGRSPATEITASSEIGALSPIETVLVTRMREAFLGYQAYYAREQAEHKEEVRSLVAQLNTPQVAAREDEECGRDTGERKATAILAAIEESKARFEAGMKALLKDFDAHAAAAVPPPSLLPTTTTVIVASRSVRFDTQLLPTHFTENIYGKIRAHYTALGDEVRGFGPDSQIYLQALSATTSGSGGIDALDGRGGARGSDPSHAPSTMIRPIKSTTQTIFSQSPGGRVGAGWALVVDGAVLLASEEVKPCFAREFGRQIGKNDPAGRVDYFWCKECKLNWLCSACAAHCHRECKGVKPFMMNHLPTWACCYCSKKRSKIGCKLANVPADGTLSVAADAS